MPHALKLGAMSAKPLLRLGTRGSPLALAQAEEVRRRLAAAHPELAAEGAVATVAIKNTGPRIQARAPSAIGGQRPFTTQLAEALIPRGIDAAVHSLPDAPT